MKNILKIKGTDDTPFIVLTKNSLNIQGRSINTDKKFFENILEKIDNVDKTSEFILSIELDYISTLTSHYLLKIIRKVEKLNSPKIKWFYEEGDDFIYEDGIDLQDSIGIKFEFIENSL